VAITGTVFHRPVHVGDEVTCYGGMERIGTTSITIKVESWARRGIGDEAFKVAEGVSTYVAVDAEGRPQPVASRAGAG
jgi:acyl-CoA thioesterase YciA